MNILIIGEFSGFAKHLKNGLRQLGHSVTIVQSGDGWKKLAAENDIICKDQTWSVGGHHILGSNRLRAIFTNFRVGHQIEEKCPEPSLIIVVNYRFLRKNITGAGVSRRYIINCVKRGAKLIMSECGESCSEAYYRPEYRKMQGLSTPMKDVRYTFLLRNSYTIIPTGYGYYEQLKAYANFLPYDTGKVSHSIPLPITVEKDIDILPCSNRKIVIFHGIIRPKAKGTPYIMEAMKRLQEEMPDCVDCICEGGLAYNDYVKLFKRVDILVDQANILNAWGMNATIGAMNGKCVLVSCGPENSIDMGIKDIPFVYIEPSANQIYTVLKNLILNPQRIDAIKMASREFAVKFCDSKVVARRYLEAVGL